MTTTLAEDMSLLNGAQDLRAEAERLNQVARDLTAELDLQILIQKVTDAGTELTSASFGAFFHNAVNQDGEAYRLFALSGAPRESFEKLGLPRNTPLFGPTFRGEGPVRIDDVTEDPRFGRNPPHSGMPAGHLPVRSYLAVPVVSRMGHVLGGLFFGHPQPGVFSERNERYALAIAALAAIAIDNATLYEQAKRELQERQQIETALRESEHRLRVALEAGRMGTWDWQIARGLVEWSAGLEEIHGRDPGTFKGTLEDVFANVHPEDRDRLLIALQDSAAGGSDFQIVYRITDGDGRTRWLESRGMLIRNHAGVPERMTGVCMDVTQRMLSEKALHETEQRFVKFMQHLPGLAWIKDAKGRYLFVNDATERAFQRSRDEILGKSDGEMFPEDIAAEFYANDRKAIASSSGVEAIERLDQADGRHYSIVSKFAMPGSGNGQPLIGGMAIDITARIHAEDALRESEERFRTVATNSPAAIYIKDLEGRYVFANPLACASLGRTDGVVGLTDHELLPAEVADSLRRTDLEVIESGRPVESEEVVRRGEYRRDFLSIRSPMRNANGRIVGVCGVAVDITDRKRADQAQASLAAIVESSDDAIIGKALDGTIRTWNAGAERLLGYKAREVIGQSVFLLIPGNLHDQEREILADLTAGRRIQSFQTTRVAKGGRPVDVSLTISPVRDPQGRIVGVSSVARDVTAQKLAESAMRDSESRYRHLVESLPAAVYTCDAEGRVTLFNEAAVDLWGRKPSIGDEWWCGSSRILRPDGSSLPLEECPMAITLREGRPVRGVEIVIERPDGTRRNVLPHPEPIRDGAGRVVGAINMLVDITQSKKAEADLAAIKDDLALQVKALTRLHELAIRMAGTPDLQPALKEVLLALVELHGAASGLITLESSAAGRLEEGAHVGLDEATIKSLSSALQTALGGNHNRFFDEKARVVIDDAEASSNQALRELRDATRAAGFRAVHCTPIKTRAGDTLGELVVFFKDRCQPTERERQLADLCARHAGDAIESSRAQQALRESELRFRHMANNAPVLIWINGVNGCEFVNREYLRFVGGTEEQVKGMGWREFLHPDDAEAYMAAYTSAFDRLAPFEAQTRFRRADGEYRWIRSSGVPRLTPDGTSFGYVGCSVDITDIKRSEEALKSAKEMAETANQSKDRFIAMLSHELRTPLTPVLMAAAAMEMNPALPESVRDDATMIQDNIRLETKLIDDLLDHSRIVAGKLRLEPAWVNVNEAVRHVCSICMPQLKEKSIRLNFRLEEALEPIQADQARMQQVLWNVLKNAAKFTPDGGAVEVRTGRSASGHLRIEIQDSGVGIAAPALSRIFNAFEQADSDNPHQFGGLGLGLAISRAIMDLHGGTIRAESQGLGRGATFVIEFPRNAPAGEQNSPRPAMSPDVPATPLRLLLVEDHADTARLLSRILGSMGYTVVAARTAAHALELAASQHFDLIISDVGLPDESGYEMMKRITTLRPIKGIAISGFGMEEDIRLSREAGFVEHIIKPVDIAQLQAAIRRVAETDSVVCNDRNESSDYSAGPRPR